MAEERQRIKRKRYLVSKKFQLMYVGLILLLMFLTAALCSYVVYYTSMITMGEKLANVYPQGRLVSIVNIVNFRILLSIILVSPLVALIGVFLSHRIAGPIYRIERFLGSMAAGDLSERITLRKYDELTTLAGGINRLADSLVSVINGQKERVSKVSAELESLKKASEVTSADPLLINNSIIRLDNEVRALKAELDKYKL